jgi:uncharacterized protein YaiI (UPF0178 family)
MHIWVDADACPKPIKEILFRAATRTGIALTLRNFMDTLRSTGVETGGPAAFSASDQHAFARQLGTALPLLPRQRAPEAAGGPVRAVAGHPAGKATPSPT